MEIWENLYIGKTTHYTVVWKEREELGVFGMFYMCSITGFNQIFGQPLLWITIVVYDIERSRYLYS